MRKLLMLAVTVAFVSVPLAADAGVRSACKQDIAEHCGEVQGGGGKIFQCLNKVSDQLQDECKEALKSKLSEKKSKKS